MLSSVFTRLPTLTTFAVRASVDHVVAVPRLVPRTLIVLLPTPVFTTSETTLASRTPAMPGSAATLSCTVTVSEGAHHVAGVVEVENGVAPPAAVNRRDPEDAAGGTTHTPRRRHGTDVDDVRAASRIHGKCQAKGRGQHVDQVAGPAPLLMVVLTTTRPLLGVLGTANVLPATPPLIVSEARPAAT